MTVDYSQQGEQAVIAEIMSGITEGCAADVGASDGLTINNTKALEEQDWKVLCIEPNPIFFEALTANRKLVLPVACSDHLADFVPFTIIKGPYGALDGGSALEPKWNLLHLVGLAGGIRGKGVVPVPVRTLDWCLQWVGFTRLDLLSIDTEGNELKVLQGFDIGRWAPKLVVVENWLDAREFKDYFERAGYTRQHRLHYNDFYVRQDA